MAHLMTSVITALMTALAIYIPTGSIGLAFVAYTLTGMAVLLAVLALAFFDHEAEPQFDLA